MRNLVLCLLVIASVLGCRSERDLGKDCSSGSCAKAPSTAGDPVPCLLASQTSEAALDPDRKRTECLALDAFLGSEGLLDCSLEWQLPGVTDCEELELEAFESTDGARCKVPQVPAQDGQPESRVARGFYYAGAASCEGGLGRIAFTEGLEAPAGVRTILNCAVALASAEDASPALNLPVDIVAVKISSCATLQAASPDTVGDTCLPSVVPEGGFNDHEAYLQTGLDECASGACLVYHLEGDPRDACEQEPNATQDAGANVCASDDDIEDRVYCTCRCDDGAGIGCACPDGFACIPLLESGGESFEGAYCVKLGEKSEQRVGLEEQ